jgi:hypothetical protein
MYSQMGVFASGQYVLIGWKSSHFSPDMDLPWMMSSRRTNSSCERFQVWQNRGAKFRVLCEERVSPLHVLPVSTIKESGGIISGGVEGCIVRSHPYSGLGD